MSLLQRVEAARAGHHDATGDRGARCPRDARPALGGRAHRRRPAARPAALRTRGGLPRDPPPPRGRDRRRPGVAHRPLQSGAGPRRARRRRRRLRRGLHLHARAQPLASRSDSASSRACSTRSPASGPSSRSWPTPASTRSWSTARTGSTSSAPARSRRSTSTFRDDEHVLNIIDRIITPLGRHIDETSPRVDARLPDGSRVNAIIKPLSLVGPVITVRKFADPLQRRRPRPLRHGHGRDVRLPAGLRRGAPQHLPVRRHRLGQDDDAQRPLVLHPRRRAHRHHRGRRRAAAQPDARHPARGPTLQPRGPGRDHHPRPRCATRCTCGPTASSSASAVPARRWT